jgi:hypothetical protein
MVDGPFQAKNHICFVANMRLVTLIFICFINKKKIICLINSNDIILIIINLNNN